MHNVCYSATLTILVYVFIFEKLVHFLQNKKP